MDLTYKTESEIYSMNKEINLKICKNMTFSAGHFTIFSATHREALHGHNYAVNVTLTVGVHAAGLAFDYRDYKKKVRALCDSLNLHFLLPAYSPFLKLEEKEDMWLTHFDQDKIPFLKKDVIILPLPNITLEELSGWFVRELLGFKDELIASGVSGIKVEIANGPEHSASTEERW